jgi:hypothetical protein
VNQPLLSANVRICSPAAFVSSSSVAVPGFKETRLMPSTARHHAHMF